MLAEQIGHLLVELADLFFDQSQFLQHHLQQSPVDWIEFCARAECVTQLLLRRTQALVGQGAARVSGLVSPPASAFSMRRALAPSRSETRLDNLMCASSSRHSTRLCNCTRLRVS